MPKLHSTKLFIWSACSNKEAGKISHKKLLKSNKSESSINK
jgi:hypothetical protein